MKSIIEVQYSFLHHKFKKKCYSPKEEVALFEEDRIVDRHIKNIRKKLDADYIETIRGVGYRIDKEN